MTEELDASWFDLNNYDALKTMSISEWAWQLQERENFIQIENFTRIYHGEPDKDFLPILKAGVIPETLGNLFMTSGIKSEILKNEAKIDGRSFSTASVNSLETYSLWQTMENNHLNHIWEACRHVDEFILNKEELKNELSEVAFAPFDFHVNRFWDTDADHSAHVVINPYASDEQIKDDLTKWLAHYRKLIDIKIEKKLFSQSDFDSWVKYGVIPYIDVMLIAKTEDKKITQNKLARMIFPDEYNVDIVERLRKVTKPIAEWLIKSKIHNALKAQLDQKNVTE